MVTASLPAMTASTPLWGELADRHSKKTLVQTALWIYIAGSVGAGLAPDAPSRERVRAACPPWPRSSWR
ncbi:hypothetical protein GCM10010345_85130 [Streptomyces canarius]|uniref:Major facilitator superfamily (MFS) profile domain-containing protein n=1 Tax=Streptomyces canarius TaxID=285453 RepID=A0ABQ3DEX2_9ACTN|nr:hypothetical protein GCM10010345_85130 [Streptomyces canarius]